MPIISIFMGWLLSSGGWERSSCRLSSFRGRVTALVHTEKALRAELQYTISFIYSGVTPLGF